MNPSIFLLYPSCFYYPTWMERVELKTSLVWLGSYLNRSYPVTFADFEIEIGRPNSRVQIKRFKRKVREYLQNQEFDILAISCWTSLSYQASVATAEICRELFPDKLIVVGGYHPSARPNEFVEKGNLFDYIIRGEGELALEEIAASCAGKRPSSPQVVTGAPVTAAHFVDIDWQLTADFVKRNLDGNIDAVYPYLSRGCPFDCSFCMEPSKDRTWRSFSPERALDQLMSINERFHSFSIGISDACFGMRSGWRKDFLSRLVESKPDFWVVFETRPEYLDPDDIALLSHLNVEVQFGLESGSPEMLRIMKKTRRPEQYLEKFREVSRLLTEHRVLHRANLIFNHPGETHQTLRETFAYMDRALEVDNSYLMWACHGFMHFPGCAIDSDRNFYEREYGSRFPCGDWWLHDSDQYEASMNVIPSRDLDNGNVGLWQRMLDERQNRMKSCLSEKAYRFAARKYFLDWQNDQRYRQALQGISP